MSHPVSAPSVFNRADAGDWWLRPICPLEGPSSTTRAISGSAAVS